MFGRGRSTRTTVSLVFFHGGAWAWAWAWAWEWGIMVEMASTFILAGNGV